MCMFIDVEGGAIRETEGNGSVSSAAESRKLSWSWTHRVDGAKATDVSRCSSILAEAEV